MKLIKAFYVLGIGLALISGPQLYACDTCSLFDSGLGGWGGVVPTMDPFGYNNLLDFYAVQSFMTPSFSSWGGGCGSFLSSCGSSAPIININIDGNSGGMPGCGYGLNSYGGWGGMTGVGYGGGYGYGTGAIGYGGLGYGGGIGYGGLGGFDGFGGWGGYSGGLVASNPFLGSPLTSFMGGTYNGLGTLNNPISIYYGSQYTGSPNYTVNPLTGVITTVNVGYPALPVPGVYGGTGTLGVQPIPAPLYPIPSFPPTGYPVGYPITSTYSSYGTYGTYPGYGTPVGYSPVLSTPPTGSVPYGACDNVVVMCPGSGTSSIYTGSGTPGSIIPVGTTTGVPIGTTTPIITSRPTGSGSIIPIGTTPGTVIGTTPVTTTPSYTYSYVPSQPNYATYPRSLKTTHH